MRRGNCGLAFRDLDSGHFLCMVEWIRNDDVVLTVRGFQDEVAVLIRGYPLSSIFHCNGDIR